jgi:uncharacterized protein
MSKKVGSRFNIPIALTRGRRLVFNAMTRAMAVWEPADVTAFDRICAGETDGIDVTVVHGFLRGGFIVREGVDELGVLEGMYDAQRNDTRKLALAVIPTLACNFACDYCYQGADKAHETMGPRVQDAIVAMAERAAPTIDLLSVLWYGGEPLARTDLILALSDRLLAVCAAHGIRWRASIFTNGYLFSREVAMALAKRGLAKIQITLDGTPEFHNARRYTLGGQGTFERIIANVKAAVDIIRTHFSIRVNIDERNGDDIHRLIDYMAEQGLGGKPNLSVYFAPIEAMTEGCRDVESVTLTKRRYAELETELQAHAYQLGLSALPRPPRFASICDGISPASVLVAPNGDLHKCYETVSFPDKRIGTIFDASAAARSEARRDWLTWTPFANDTCRNCKILPNCAGGCAYKYIHSQDTRGEAAVLPCPSWKYQLKERLLARAIAKGTLTAADVDPAQSRTEPAELCADTAVGGGAALPAAMQPYYDRQRKVRLPIVAG